jgi:hypothetical protein
MKKALHHLSQARICFGLKLVVTQTKEMKNAIDQEWLNKFKSMRIMLSDLNTKKLVKTALIRQDEIFFFLLHGIDESIDGLH